MNIIEILFKIAVTVIIIIGIYVQALFLRWLWPTQIDIKATFSRIIRKASPETDVFATRDPNKIYQNGESVGDVTGDIVDEGNQIIFRQLSNTSKLNQKLAFEHKRDSYQILKIEKTTGLKIDMSNHSTSQATAVLENVYCKKLE